MTKLKANKTMLAIPSGVFGGNFCSQGIKSDLLQLLHKAN